jgi:pilus assembly protein TadC
MLILGIVCSVIGFGVLIYVLMPESSSSPASLQLKRSGTQGTLKKESNVKSPQTGAKSGKIFGTRKKTRISLKERLFRAGIVSDGELKKFYLIKAFSPVVGFLIGFGIPALFFSSGAGVGLGVVLAAMGFVYPSFYLRKREKMQQEEISYYLPITIEQIAIGVSSGLDLGPCIQFLIDLADERKSHNAVSQLLKLAVQMSRQGVPFDEALLELGKASGNADLKHCFLALGQVYKHGGEVSKQLMEIAASVTAQRQIKIDEKIKKIPLKAVLVVGVILFAFILMILVGVGVSLFNQLRQFNSDAASIQENFN